MVERVNEERAGGKAERAHEIRERIGAVVGDKLRDLKPGSAEAAQVKSVLIEAGFWSQYLEVGIGPDAEVFTKAQVLSSVGWGAAVGLHPVSRWNNPEAEIVPGVRPSRALHDGEEIDLGGRTLTVIHTPGHAPDSLCLYEPETRTLLAGDTVLAAAFWLHGAGADLAAFAASTARLADLRIDRVLTAHNLVAEKPGSYVADVARAARVVLSGESIPRPGVDLLGNRAARHDVDGVIVLTPEVESP
jgi:glyoxylase-like metal-dependent hydrolase (beta-lactamase superfamily II)